MKFTELKMYNFGPYKNEQKLSFPTIPNQGVMAVFGENMRGKTSLMNALRWVLYGRAINRHSREIGLIDIVNRDAQREHEYKVWVSLSFEHDGDIYELRRIAKPFDMIAQPRSNSDFEIEPSLSKNGSFIPKGSIDHEINQIIPEQISRFHLFDGELLQEYEMLLMEDSDQGKRIKDAIEQVLGVPALINGRDEIRTQLKKAQAIQARETKNVQSLSSHSAQSMQIQAEIERIEEDLKKQKEKETDFAAQISDIDDQLANTKAAQDAEAQLTILRARKKTISDAVERLEADQQLALKSAWKDLLQPRLQARVSELEGHLRAHTSGVENRAIINDRVTKLQSILDHSRCSMCEQDIQAQKREEFGAQLGTLLADLQAIDLDEENFGSLNEEYRKLLKLAGTGAATTLKRIERDLSSNLINLTQVESDIEMLDESVRGFDTAKIALLRHQRDGLIKLQAKAEQDIDKSNKVLDEKRSKLTQLHKLMSQNPAARHSRSTREVEIYSALDQIFSESISLLRDRLRSKVAAEATDVFLQLINEKTYQGLDINSNYGLTIKDRFGQSVPIRSAGAEQIVALALISALNRTANKSGPVVMDTPLGRLDPNHRENILAFVPKMADQVVFLVHEGEVDRQTGLAPVNNHVGAVYEIERVSSSQSILRKV